MWKFTYRQMIRERVTAKCDRHPRYNPEKDGRNGIKGGCSTCYSLYDLYQARVKLDTAIHEFIRRVGPWSRPRERRKGKSSTVVVAPVKTPEIQP